VGGWLVGRGLLRRGEVKGFYERGEPKLAEKKTTEPQWISHSTNREQHSAAQHPMTNQQLPGPEAGERP